MISRKKLKIFYGNKKTRGFSIENKKTKFGRANKRQRSSTVKTLKDNIGLGRNNIKKVVGRNKQDRREVIDNEYSKTQNSKERLNFEDTKTIGFVQRWITGWGESGERIRIMGCNSRSNSYNYPYLLYILLIISFLIIPYALIVEDKEVQINETIEKNITRSVLGGRGVIDEYLQTDDKVLQTQFREQRA